MAMSGGVDSSVAAAVLVDAAHDVTGVTMKLWGGDSDTGCCSVADVDDARRVAQQLDIAHFVFNFTGEFDRDVVDPYVAAHAAGRTPNPCIECNRHLKFAALSERAAQLGFDALATGHHATIAAGDDGPRVARGADRAKDQSYVLHMLGPEVLSRCLFPIGHLPKVEVRRLASELGLRTAAKPESQDVCFITRQGRRGFLAARIPLRPGRLVDAHGSTVGRVDAVELVTVGQRKGLDLGGASGRRYATHVDVETATVTVGGADELLVAGQALTDRRWAGAEVRGAVLAQVSAHGRPALAELDGTDHLRWQQPAPRVAPGQAVVFYDLDDRVVLGGALAA